MANSRLEVIIALRDQFSAAAKGVVGSLNQMQSSAGRVGKGFGQLGAGLLRIGAIAGTATVGFIAAATKASISLESAMAGVNKTVDFAPGELDAMKRSLQKLSTEIPLSVEELAGLAEAAGALGIAKQDILEFTKVTATIGVTTDVASDQAATALGQLSNVLGLTSKDYSRFASALVDLGNKGASTESQILEIANRSGAGAKLIGLSTDAVLGFASAAANLGIQVEAGGTNLQKFYLEAQKIVAVGGKDLKLLGEIAGMTGKQFEQAFAKDAEGALVAFLGGLGKLSAPEQVLALEALGLTGDRMRRLLLGLANNTDMLEQSLETSAQAWEANVAAAEEADKRYATTESKLKLLHAQVKLLATVVGDEMLPALGVVSDKLKKALGDPRLRQDLKQLGQDFAGFIKSIEWDDVLRQGREFAGLLREAAGFAKTIFEWVNKLPEEVKAGGIGFLAANQLSGGLIGKGIGNIVGGLGAAAARGGLSKAPVVGKFFAQPVFVTNWPPGMALGGGAGVAGGAGGKLGLARFLGGVALSGAALVTVLQDFWNNPDSPIAGAIKKFAPGVTTGADLQEMGARNISGVEAMIARGDINEMTTALKGMKEDIAQMPPLQRALYELNAMGTKTHTESLIIALEQAIARGESDKTGGGAVGAAAAAAIQAAMPTLAEQSSSIAEGILERSKAKYGGEGKPWAVEGTFNRNQERAMNRILASNMDPSKKLDELIHILALLRDHGTPQAKETAGKIQTAIDALQDVVSTTDSNRSADDLDLKYQLNADFASLEARLRLLNMQPVVNTNVTVNVTGREVTKSVSTATSYGANTSSYYGGQILRTGTGGQAIF